MTLTLEEMKANRKAWVDALRSGKYRQGTGRLRSSKDTFCCLGVLADIAGCKWYGQVADGDYSKSAPLRAREFVGLSTGEGWLSESKEYLTTKNDTGTSFAEIADIIESEPAGLFIEVAP